MFKLSGTPRVGEKYFPCNPLCQTTLGPRETSPRVILISLPVNRVSSSGVGLKFYCPSRHWKTRMVIFRRVHNAVVLFAHTKILERCEYGKFELHRAELRRNSFRDIQTANLYVLGTVSRSNTRELEETTTNSHSAINPDRPLLVSFLTLVRAFTLI